MKFFKEYSNIETAHILANYLPNGSFLKNKHNEASQLFKFLKGITKINIQVIQNFNTICQELFPSTSQQLLQELEAQFKLPDDVFPAGESIAERQFYILTKIKASRIRSEIDYHDLASDFGLEIEVLNSYQVGLWDWTWGHIWCEETTKKSKFTTLIKFINLPSTTGSWNWTWEHAWTTDPTEIFRKLLLKIKPANNIIKFINF